MNNNWNACNIDKRFTFTPTNNAPVAKHSDFCYKLSPNKLLVTTASAKGESIWQTGYYIVTVNTKDHTCSWTAVQNSPVTGAYPMIAQFGNGQLLVGGGVFDGGGYASTDYYLGTPNLYNNTISWSTSKGSTPIGIGYQNPSICTLSDGRIFKLNGIYYSYGAFHTHQNVEILKLNGSSVQSTYIGIENTPGMPIISSAAMIEVSPGKVLVVGGSPNADGGDYKPCWIVTIIGNSISWKRINDFDSPVVGCKGITKLYDNSYVCFGAKTGNLIISSTAVFFKYENEQIHSTLIDVPELTSSNNSIGFIPIEDNLFFATCGIYDSGELSNKSYFVKYAPAKIRNNN